MSKEKEIKRINKVQIVGTLAEVGNLKYDETAEKEVTVNGEKKKIKGAITRADFKKPAFVVDVNGQMVGITTLPTYKKKKANDKEELVANERFKAMETIMEYEVGTRVKIDASISVGNPYKGKDGFVSVQMFNMSSTSVPEEDFAEGKVSGYIKSIKDETKGEDEEETGRLAVDFWIVNYDGTVSPFPLVVEDDIKEGFENTYEDGSSAILLFDVVSKQIGSKKSQGAGFGRKKSNITEGYTVTEYSIFDGEEPLDDESDYYIDEDVFKKLIKGYKQKKEESKNSDNNSSSSSNKGLGSARKSHIEDADDDDCPFDD